MLPQVLVLDSELRDHGGCRGELALEFPDVGTELVDRGALVGDLSLQSLPCSISWGWGVDPRIPLFEEGWVPVHGGSADACLAVEVLLDEAPIRVFRSAGQQSRVCEYDVLVAARTKPPKLPGSLVPHRKP